MIIKVDKQELYNMIIEIYADDIKYEITRFMRSSTMEDHLYEDLHQEALILLFTRLDKYDPSLSGLRTFTVRTAEIACLRYRTGYFKLRTAPDFVLEEESGYDSTTVSSLLGDLGIEGKDKLIILDRIGGYTLLEISAKHDVSVNTVYRLMNEVKEIMENG